MTDRFGTCLICDDVRNEVSNQISVVGLYGTELIVGSLPLVIPQLCFLTSVFCRYDDPLKRLTVRVSFAGELLNEASIPHESLDEWARADGTAAASETEEFIDDEPPKIRCSVLLTTSPLRIEKEGRLSVHAETERETIRAGSLKVRVQTSQ